MYNYFPGFIATPTKIRNFLECPSKLRNRPVGRISYLFLSHGKRNTEEISIDKNVDTIKCVIEVVNQIPKSRAKEDFVCPRGDGCYHCDYLRELGFDPITGKQLLL